MHALLPVLIDGVVYSAYLFVIAVGLTLIYGVMKILNIAHGGFYALGAYVYQRKHQWTHPPVHP